MIKLAWSQAYLILLKIIIFKLFCSPDDSSQCSFGIGRFCPRFECAVHSAVMTSVRADTFCTFMVLLQDTGPFELSKTIF